jgi:multiple sugar transport system substrate-binding protein
MRRDSTGWPLGIVVVVFAVVLGACTTSGEEDTPATEVEDEEGTSGESVSLNLWVLAEPEGSEAFLPALKEAFEAEHPNITVQITEIPEDTYFTRIDTALVADSPPDIGYIFEPRWVRAGRVLPLNDVIAEQDIDVSAYNQTALAGCGEEGSLEGDIYCFGSNLGTVMLLYNKEMFDEADLDYPAANEAMSIDEYAELAAALSQPGADVTEHVWGGVGEAPIWWMDSATHFSEDGRTTEGFVNDASTIHTYDVLTGLIRDGHAPSGAAYELFSNTDLLAEGRLAMTISDSFADIPTLDAAGINWGAAPVPVERDGDPAFVPSWTDPFGVFVGSPNPEAAKLFVAFAATEGNRLRVEVGDDLPLDLELAEQWAGDNPGRSQVADVAQLARPGVFVPNYWEVVAPIWDLFEVMVQGDMTAQEALDQAAEEMQETLDREWATWDDIERLGG